MKNVAIAVASFLLAVLLTSCSEDDLYNCFECGKPTKESLVVWTYDEGICPNCFAADGGENYRFCLSCGKAYKTGFGCSIGYCYDCTEELFAACCICEEWPLQKNVTYQTRGVYVCSKCVAAYCGDLDALNEYIVTNSVYITD